MSVVLPATNDLGQQNILTTDTLRDYTIKYGFISEYDSIKESRITNTFFDMISTITTSALRKEHF